MYVKKIMFLCHGAGNGGAERVVTTLANGFALKGYVVSLVTTNESNNDYAINETIKREVIISNAGNSISRTIERVKELRKYIKLSNPDCIVSFSAISNMQVLAATMGLNKKVVISERTDPSRYPSSSVAKFLRLLLYPKASKIVFQTKDAKLYFPKRIQKKGVVIFNPIRDNLPNPYHGKREKRIVGIGSLGEQKNWMIALKASEIFFETFPDYVFDIFGEGPDRKKLQRYIDSHAILNGRVTLKGFSHKAVEEMNKARMFVSSSNYEGIPNSMLEALATGVPTIYTDCPVGGPREFIKDGENGFLVKVGDANLLAEKMKELARNDELCDCFSKNSIRIREDLSLHKIIAEWIKLI